MASPIVAAAFESFQGDSAPRRYVEIRTPARRAAGERVRKLWNEVDGLVMIVPTEVDVGATVSVSTCLAFKTHRFLSNVENHILQSGFPGREHVGKGEFEQVLFDLLQFADLDDHPPNPIHAGIVCGSERGFHDCVGESQFMHGAVLCEGSRC
jgi:hypothetical protein